MYGLHPNPNTVPPSCAIAVVQQLVDEGAFASAGAHFHFGLDFVRDRTSGELYCLECNPRATNGIALLAAHPPVAAAAVDAYRAACGAFSRPSIQIQEDGSLPSFHRRSPAIVPAGFRAQTAILALRALVGQARGHQSSGLTTALQTWGPLLRSTRDDIVSIDDPLPVRNLPANCSPISPLVGFCFC